MTDKPIESQMREMTTESPLTWGDEAELVHDFIEKLLKFRREALTLRDQKDELESRLMVSDRENQMLHDQVRIAQRQQIDVLEDNSKKDQRIAILEARLQIIKDQTAEGEIGENIHNRLGEGKRAFPEALGYHPSHQALGDIPMPFVAQPGAHKGKAYQSVLADAQANARAADPMAALLSIAREEFTPDPESKVSIEIFQKIEAETAART